MASTEESYDSPPQRYSILGSSMHAAFESRGSWRGGGYRDKRGIVVHGALCA